MARNKQRGGTSRCPLPFMRLFYFMRPFFADCPVLNMVYTFPPNKWRARWDKV